MGGASLPVGTAWCHNGVRYPLPRLVGRTRPPILFSASDSRYSHYPLHERRYPYRQSAHLCVLFVLLLVALTKRDWRETMFILRCVLFSVFFLCFVMQIMKYGLGMPRPGFPWPPYPLGFINQYASFPSGHTATIITAAVPLALWFRNRPFSLFLSAVIALMGFSRVWLGQHHPIDIVGGMLLGSIAARCIACERLPMGKEEQQALGEQKIREETGK